MQATPQSSQPRLLEWLVKAKTTRGLKSPHFWVMFLMVGAFIYFTYVLLPVFYDVYIIFLFAPLIYAAIVYRLRGAIIGSIVFVGLLVPHGLPLTLNAYTLVRSFVFVAFPFLVSGLIAISLTYFERQLAAYREILALNETLNDYIERLEKTQKQLIQVEKMNALGQLSASIAHEINNPLAGVLVYIRLIIKKVSGDTTNKEEILNILSKVDLAVTQSAKLVRNLLDFARQSTPTLEPISVSSVIDQAIALVGHQAELKKVKVLRNEMPGLPLVMGDFSQLQQVFINLIVNAIQAMSDGGELRINTSRSDSLVAVAVKDTGRGIPPGDMDKLFTPFFSTKEEVRGVGLGLAVSYGIIQRHGGRIEVRSQVGKGSTFTVYLPVYQEEVGQPATGAQ